MEYAVTYADFVNAAKEFASLDGYKDSNQNMLVCLNKAKAARLKTIVRKAIKIAIPTVIIGIPVIAFFIFISATF